MRTRSLRLTAALVAAVFLCWLVTLPPRVQEATGEISAELRQRTVHGALHVHSSRSDGSGDRHAIAAAASAAGLRFVVVTDHGDGTRQPDPPAYLHGVLMLDGVEVSTSDGHVVALGLPQTPYPLGGAAAAVVEDIRRLGGVSIAAHPISPKPELRWTDWSVPIDGIEWLNLDSEWRDESASRLARAAAAILVRPGPALASLLDAPDAAFARWNSIASARRLIGVAGHDAHGGVASRAEDGERWAGGGPSYSASFKAFAVRVVMDKPWLGKADADARSVLEALRGSRVFTAIDGFAVPAWADFEAVASGVRYGMGDVVPLSGEVELRFRATVPPNGELALLKDGAPVARSPGGEVTFLVRSPGAYRAEVRVADSPTPWLVTNPIYVHHAGDAFGRALAAAEPAGLSVLELRGGSVVEKDAASTAELSATDVERTLQFRLRADVRASQYVAMALPLEGQVPAFERVVFSGRASRPMRLSVQLRFESAGGARWVSSVYLSPEQQEIVVPVSRLRPAEGRQPLPAVDRASSVLFVVDLTNAAPGAQGSFHISDLRLTR